MTNSNNANVRLNLTLPALERLIGDNPQLQIELSQQVCDAFIRNKIFKSIENSIHLASVGNKLTEEVNDQIKKAFGIKNVDWYNRITNWDMPVEWQTLITNKVRETVDTHIRNRTDLTKIISDAVEARLNQVIDFEIKQQVRAKIAKAMESLK